MAVSVKQTKLLKLKNDLVFKAVYARENDKESKILLIHLLNLILDRKDDPITDITYLNPFSVNQNPEEKNIIMDIKVQTTKGERIGIEMQVIPYKLYTLRTVYYEGKNVSDGLERGQNYDKMNKTMIISFVDGVLFDEFKKFHSCFRMLEEKEHVLLDEKADEIHFVEFGKLDIQKPVSEMSETERYCAFMMLVGEENTASYIAELIKYDGKGGFINMTLKALENISEDEKMRHLATSREMFMLDQKWREQCAREEEKARMTEIAVINAIQKGIKYKISKQDILNDIIYDYELSADIAQSYIDKYWQ